MKEVVAASNFMSPDETEFNRLADFGEELETLNESFPFRFVGLRTRWSVGDVPTASR